MTNFAIPFAITASCYLIIGVWSILGRRGAVQRFYGALCLVTCLWQSTWVVLFSRIEPSTLFQIVKLFYTGVVFIPAIFYHFIIEFTQQHKDKRWLWKTYFLSTALAVSIWNGPIFIDGLYHYSWGSAARRGFLHPVFVFIIVVVIFRTLVLLTQRSDENQIPELKKRQRNLVGVATAVYYGGALDLISQYGLAVFPFSFLFTGIALILFGYATLRYEFLDLTGPGESEDERIRREAASQEMSRLNMVAAFPLVSQGELLGYLLLGEKMSEESYSKEDLLLLRIVANQAALAYQRVRYLEMAVHGARTEMLGEIAGGFAHEIKTPLANISLPAELCFMDLTDIEQGKRKFEEVLPELKQRMKGIMEQAFKASEKIEAVRQFSKPGQIRLESIELAKVLHNSLSLLDHLLRKTNVKVRTEFPSIMAPIRGDAKQLEIVFVNLIKNAAEAMAANVSNALARELWLKGHEEGEWIVATIKDTGPGIKRTDFGHIFQAYFTTKGSEGTGMGLFLSQQVIKAHGGSIDVKSEEGKGTEFIIRLPKYVNQEQTGVHRAA